MDKMQSQQHTLREETLTHNNTLNSMICLKKHPINKISVIMHTRKFKVMRGALKMLDVKMTDVKLTDQFAGHEIAGHEIEGPMCRA